MTLTDITGPSSTAMRTVILACIPALLAGVTAIVIMGQTVARIETSQRNDEANNKVLEQRVNDIDSHGSRQLLSMEGRIKAIEDRNIEQDRRLGAADASMALLMGRFIIVEDRLAACQGCHMGGGAAALQAHMKKQQGGK